MRSYAWTLGLLGAVALSGASLAQEPSNQPSRLIEQPDWARKPTGQDIARFYPSEAARKLISGGAVIECAVTSEGLLADCHVVEEAPAGLGFGEAALKLSRIFKMRPVSKDGQPVAGGTVRIPILMMVS